MLSKLKLAVNSDDLELIHAIEAGQKDLNTMSSNESHQLQQIAVNHPNYQNEVYSLTSKMFSPSIEGLLYDERNPFWFSNNTKFEDDIWTIQVSKKNKVIDFNITLNDGNKLTSIKHRPLLNAFKYWLVAQGNPFYNGGKIVKPTTIQHNLNRVLTLIDALLINGGKIKLAERHLGAIDEGVALDILSKIAKYGVTEGIYSYTTKVKEYLANNIDSVTDIQLSQFKEMFPYAFEQHVLAQDNQLTLTESQRVKACCFLYHHNAYVKGGGATKVPNSAIFYHLHKDTFAFKNQNLPKFDELAIKPLTISTEYNAIPVKDDSTLYNESGLREYITIFRTLLVVNGHNDASSLPVDTIKNISVQRIKKLVELKPNGRYTTLPATLVFKTIRNAFEFVLDHTDTILDTAFNALSNRPHKNMPLYRNGKNTATIEIYKEDFINHHVPDCLKALGVKNWRVLNSEVGCFDKRRANEDFTNLFHVLMGSIQILVGATMGRRAGELIDLNATDNLLPKKVNPNTNREVDFELVFDNRKSGIGGKHGARETLSRPVLNSVAGLIYKLQQFNKKLIEANIYKKSQLSLFTTLNAHKITLHKVEPATYANNLDAFCDYFETDVIEYIKGDKRRYYIRQHQLRRFFAMVFFWSKGFDGLDTLRHFLGHTDLEHLYHYITEGATGQVLAGVKAKYLIESMDKNHVQNIEKLEPILKKHFKTKAISIQSVDDAIDDYEDEEEFTTLPPIKTLQGSMTHEGLIADLISNHIIDLQPEFFTVKDRDGNESRDFNLVLKVYNQEGQ